MIQNFLFNLEFNRIKKYNCSFCKTKINRNIKWYSDF